MARLLVTGGSGFVGSHLVDLLLNRGDSVVVVDNLSSGRQINLAHHDSNPALTFVEADVSLGIECDAKLDAVVHMASLASPVAYLAHPLETLAVGSEGTRHALELAHRNHARFLLASTSEVYGDPAVHPQREDYWGNVNPVGPRSVYDESKRFAESLTMAYHRTLGVDTRIARIFNTYGPRMQADDGRVVSNFICQALRGEPLTVYGQGTQTRSFCFVEDEVAGLLALLDSDVSTPVNIGNPDEVTMIELAQKVGDLIPGAEEVVHEPLPVDDPTKRQPDIGLATSKLGWQPDIQLDQGLALTIEYFRRELDL